MKKLLAVSVLTIAVLLGPIMRPDVAAQHSFGFKEYDRFHDVLHPLEHEALPNKDFRRIRAKSSQLTKRGKAIVKLGVPKGKVGEGREEFERELQKFGEALNKFRADSKNATDDQLRSSYSAVHDSFEMLASMLRAN